MIWKFFFRILKQEIYYEKVYYSYEELEQAIIKYIDYYNNKIMVNCKMKLNKK